MKKFQVVFAPSENDASIIHSLDQPDAEALVKIGVAVGTAPHADATKLMYRGFCIYNEDKYPIDSRYINGFKENIFYQRLSSYYPLIADLTIETFFVDDLNDNTIELLKQKKWDKAFIKKDIKSLDAIDDGKSVYPETSLAEMKRLFDDFPFDGKYAIRKYIEPAIIKEEQRYWVLNGNVYHRTGIIPPIVQLAANRLNSMGSKYYTIDATPDFVVEVNPGESSDRHAVNSADLFASWIKQEFDN